MSDKSEHFQKTFISNAFDGKETSNIDLQLCCKSLETVHILVNAMPLRGEKEELIGVIAIGWDITEHRKSERHRNELQTFVDTANAPIFGIDANGRVNEWNNKSAEITSFTREEMIGKDLATLCIGADFRRAFRDVLDSALLGQGTANFELPLFTKDQRRVEMLLNVTPRTDISGGVIGMLGVGQDITERKKVEVEKMSLAQELQTFIDTANAPIFGIDAYGLVNEWNNKSAEITGFSREEVLGKNLVEVYISIRSDARFELIFFHPFRAL